MPSDRRATWDLNSLEAVLQETMDLARLRAVAPDSGDRLIWVEDPAAGRRRSPGDGENWTWIRMKPEPLSGRRAINRLLRRRHASIFQGRQGPLFVAWGPPVPYLPRSRVCLDRSCCSGMTAI